MGLMGGRKAVATLAAFALAYGFAHSARADTIEAALVRAYADVKSLSPDAAEAAVATALLLRAIDA